MIYGKLLITKIHPDSYRDQKPINNKGIDTQTISLEAMNFIRQIERMQVLNKLIREQRTGSPEELADRLGLSRRQLYAYLEYMKDHGLNICFSRKLNSFIFCDEKEMRIDLRIEVLKQSEICQIQGGLAFRLSA